jgi:ATP-dependent Lhr-like helicase
MSRLTLDVVELRVPSPFSLPLMVERFREQLSTEKLEDRLARMLREAEAAAATAAADEEAQRLQRRGTHASDTRDASIPREGAAGA